jgi:hypothetical protein
MFLSLPLPGCEAADCAQYCEATGLTLIDIGTPSRRPFGKAFLIFSVISTTLRRILFVHCALGDLQDPCPTGMDSFYV